MAALSKQYEKGTIGKLEFKVAGTNVLNQYKKDMLELAPSIERVHAAHTALLYTLTKTVVAYRAVTYTINQIKSGIGAITSVGIELDSVKASLTATMGSASGMASALQALDSEANRTGISIGTLRENFKNFQASTSLAGATVDQTWSMFTKLNTVITGLHLSTDKAKGVFTAMSQIFNKSKVQSEELVKQLGNLLPGAFASFAASMHISTQDLAKQMKAGTVYAQDTMEGFISYLSTRFAPAFAAAQDNLNANWGRFGTAVTKLKETIYGSTDGMLNSTTKVMTKFVTGIDNMIKGTDRFSDTTNTIMKTTINATIALFGLYIASLLKAVGGLEGLGAAAGRAAAQAKIAAVTFRALTTIIIPVAVITSVLNLADSFIAVKKAAGEAQASINEVIRAQRKRKLEDELGSTEAGKLVIKTEDSPRVVAIRNEIKALQDAKQQYIDTNYGVGAALAQGVEAIIGTRTLKQGSEERVAWVRKQNKNIQAAEKELSRERAAESKGVIDEQKNVAKQQHEARLERTEAEIADIEDQGNRTYDSAVAEITHKTAKLITAQKKAIDNAAASKAKYESEQLKRGSSKEAIQYAKEEADKDQARVVAYANTIGRVKADVMETWNKKAESASKKGASSAKAAARERLAGIKEDIDVESQFAKTLEQKRREELEAIDTLNSNTIISYEDFARRKLKVLTESYEKEKKIYEEQKRQAEGSGNKKMAATADQNLERLTSAFKADTKTLKVDEEGSLKDFKTTLADIHGQYQDILGVERDTDDLTKQRLVDLRARLVAEIEEKGILSDVSAERLKEFDITRKLEASQRQYKILMEETRVINDKHGEALTRNQALNQAGLISDYEKARLNTIANKERIKGLEDAIRKEEELIATSKNPQSASATENIRKMRAELENLKLSADEVGVMVENSLGNAFESSFQGLITGTMSAKQAFSNFATSVVADIAKIVAQEVKSAVIGAFIRPLINAGMGALGGMFNGAATQAPIQPTQNLGGSTPWASDMFKQSANGNVFASNQAGISAYSGTIVDKPTIFPFAKGTGLMGEAGAEAILPLKRNSQGKLGVSVENGGQAAKSNVYYINTTVNAGSNASPTDIANKTSEALMRAIAKQEISTAARPGNQLNRSSKFG
jgi:tape measure domain-containing protein